jgi:2,3-dihydroxybenzoate decarboxylase
MKRATSICLRTVYDYFKRNIWVTTSEHFLIATLKLVIDEIGADRILSRVEFLYETVENGCA